MPLWTYADWITYSDADLSAKLTRLRLHIQEVSQRVAAVEGRTHKMTEANQDYLQALLKREKELAEEVVPRGRRRNIGEFSRG